MVRKTRKRQTIRRNEVTQTFDGELRKFYDDWENLCKGLSRDDIGITGKKGGRTLYDMVLNHVSSAVQRPNSPNTGNVDGANYEVMDELKKIMTTNELITVSDLKEIKSLIGVLNKMSSNDSDLNPANIPFNVRFRRGRGRTVSKEIYGHYRTDDYVAIRNADPRKKDETVEAVSDDWWSMSKDGSARPPMYQALFGDGDKIGEDESLTGVLNKLTKSLPSAKIPFLDIKVNYDPSDLSKIPEFKKTLDALVKSPAIKGRDGKVSPTKLQRQLQNSKIQINSKGSSDLIKDVAGLVGDNEVLGQVEAFSITLTKRMLKRYAGQFDFELKKSWADVLKAPLPPRGTTYSERDTNISSKVKEYEKTKISPYFEKEINRSGFGQELTFIVRVSDLENTTKSFKEGNILVHQVGKTKLESLQINANSFLKILEGIYRKNGYITTITKSPSGMDLAIRG